MKEIKDARKKLICKIDEKTGILENIYRKQELKIKLEIGQKIQIIRDDVVTLITRKDKVKYNIKSFKKTE